MYGFSFADVRVRLVDYDEEKDFEVKVLLDTLDIESANLDYERQRITFFVLKTIRENTNRTIRLDRNSHLFQFFYNIG